MRVKVSTKSRAGFTLIEMVISASLMALILVSAYLCLSAGFSAQKMVEPRTEVIQNARVAMAIMTADLRGACSLSKDYDFLGTQRTMGEVEGDSLDFATHNYTPRGAREGDYCQESLYVDIDEETGQYSLFRRRNPTIALDALSGGSKEEIAKGILGLRFEYYDGLDWYDSWGEVKPAKRDTSQKQQPNLSGMPNAVRITLLLDSNPKSKAKTVSGERQVEPPLAFQTVVQLNLTESVMNNSRSASTGSSDGSDNSGTSGGAQGQPNGAGF